MSRTILIADNNAFYRQVLGDFFRSEGYRVTTAADGVEALERIGEGDVDLVLLDLIMPRIDGARVCRFIKSQENLASIPVIILSGILADEIEEFETIGADAYIAKMPMDQLQEMLMKVIPALESGSPPPLMQGFERMYRREVVLELLEERRARDLIQNALSEGIVELSDTHRILKTNNAFERMAGRTGAELLSLPIEEVFGESGAAVRTLFENLAADRAEHAGALVRFHGRPHRLRVHTLADRNSARSTIHPTMRRAAEENPKVRLLQPGKLPGYVMLVEDVAEQVRAQEERELFRDRMSRGERMSALGMFVAGAAHEVNNPLTAVLGYAQLLASRNLPPDVKESLKKIEAGATRCRSIVENLLVFSHRGQKERRRESVGDLVRTAVAERLPAASAAGVEITTELEPSVPEAEACGAEIVQALAAVLDNAVRAAAERPAPRRVRVRMTLQDGYAGIEVSDTGPGIPERIMGKIFDPFFTTRDVGQGKGLGLSVAYGIIRAHSGTITARNLPEGGACLTLKIPCLAGAAAEAPAAPGALPPRRGARILVVDDEPVVLDLVTDALRTTHRVETAANGRDGLAKATREAYDVILLDMKMPDMTGRQMYEALAGLRPEMADRVVFTTGDTVQEETRRFLETVVNPCLGKPFSLDALADAVDRVLSASRTV